MIPFLTEIYEVSMLNKAGFETELAKDRFRRPKISLLVASTASSPWKRGISLVTGSDTVHTSPSAETPS
jgi:hypothetical protein